MIRLATSMFFYNPFSRAFPKAELGGYGQTRKGGSGQRSAVQTGSIPILETQDLIFSVLPSLNYLKVKSRRHPWHFLPRELCEELFLGSVVPFLGPWSLSVCQCHLHYPLSLNCSPSPINLPPPFCPGRKFSFSKQEACATSNKLSLVRFVGTALVGLWKSCLTECVTQWSSKKVCNLKKMGTKHPHAWGLGAGKSVEGCSKTFSPLSAPGK